MDKETQIPTLSKTAVICCGNLEKMDLGWMVTEDGVKLMPFIDGEKIIKYRVNNCPCCGAYVRDCTIQPQHITADATRWLGKAHTQTSDND